MQDRNARSLCKSRTSSYEAFKVLQHFFAREAEVFALAYRAEVDWLQAEQEPPEPRLLRIRAHIWYESRAGQRLRATIATSRLRPHSLLTTPGNQSRWYVAALLARTIRDISIFLSSTTCDSAKSPAAETPAAKTPPAKTPHSDHLFSLQQVRYAATEIESAKSARARGSYLRVSFKNTRETAQAINGWKVTRALQYLENVKGHVEAVPMRRYAGSTGRTAQGT